MGETVFDKYVYLGHEGRVFKLSLDEWEEVCKAGIGGSAVDLTQFQRMRARPSWLSPFPTGGGFYRTRKDRVYYEPCEWSRQDFQDALEELENLRAQPDT